MAGVAGVRVVTGERSIAVMDGVIEVTGMIAEVPPVVNVPRMAMARVARVVGSPMVRESDQGHGEKAEGSRYQQDLIEE
jgi:hypothetical protein